MWRACQQRENSLIDYYVSNVLSASGISVKASLIKESIANCRHQLFFFTCLVSSITMLQSIQESKARKYPKRRKQTGFKLQLSRYKTMFTFACGGLWKFLLNNSSADWMTQLIGFFSPTYFTIRRSIKTICTILDTTKFLFLCHKFTNKFFYLIKPMFHDTFSVFHTKMFQVRFFFVRDFWLTSN